MVQKRLAELLALPRSEVHPVQRSEQHPGVDALLAARELNFAIEYKGSAGSAALLPVFPRLQAAAQQLEAVPLLVTPFMGELGKKLCAEAQIPWLDLSGNSHIILPERGLYVHVEGFPNLFQARGRPASVFAPKSSRIARFLLLEPSRFISQRELAEATAMDEGFTSRIVRRLSELHLIERNEQGWLRPRDPNLLLDSWNEEYDFKKHELVAGHVPARSGQEVLKKLHTALRDSKVEFAATGLAAAWLLGEFASFRIATFYLATRLERELLEQLSFRADPKGANLWLAYPNDEGVFQGARVVDKVPCVHPVQVWLDLQGHPERALEAAEQLRQDLWKPNHV